MQLVSSIKIVFLCGKKILYGNPSELKKGDTVLLVEPKHLHYLPPEVHLYRVESMVARMDRGVYMEVRVKKADKK